MTVTTISNNNNNTTLQLPFWFGKEDPVHVEHLMKMYSKHFKLNEGRARNARAPLQFIGKIARYSNPFLNKSIFETIDYVYIYQRACLCQGKTMPLLKKYTLKTQWCTLEGVPLRFESSTASEPKDAEAFFLYCLPEFSELPTDCNKFKYFSDKQEYLVGHADTLSQAIVRFFNDTHSRHLRHEQEEEEEVFVFSEEEEEEEGLQEDEDEDEEEEQQQPQARTIRHKRTATPASVPDYLSSLLFGGDSPTTLPTTGFGQWEEEVYNNFDEEEDDDEDAYDSNDDEEEEQRTQNAQARLVTCK